MRGAFSRALTRALSGALSRDAPIDSLSFDAGDARSDVTSIELSDGRGHEASLRASTPRSFPTNSETSFLADFQPCLERRVCRHRLQAAAGRFVFWLPEDHLAHFISDLVDELDLWAIMESYDGSAGGQPAYHPLMMVKLLLYD